MKKIIIILLLLCTIILIGCTINSSYEDCKFDCGQTINCSMQVPGKFYVNTVYKNCNKEQISYCFDQCKLTSGSE